MASNSEQLSPESIGVKTVATSDLKPNPHNPRTLFDREPLETLKNSIGKVGILVPLTVYRAKSSGKYIILDGQRRWMCAKSLGLKTVPVNQVAEPTLVQNIVTMFQIHKLREDWELMPTALKLELLMDELKERGDKRIASLTGLDQAVVVRCKKLLSYSKRFQDMMLDPNPNNRVKADFFIELHAVRNDRLVNSMNWFRKDHFTKRMLDKYQSPDADLKAVTDFRKMKQYITNAKKAEQVPEITKRLKNYTEDDAVGLDSLAIDTVEIDSHVRQMSRSIENLHSSISELVVEDYFGQDELWSALEKLAELIKVKLSEADRRPKA